ncbi:MAG TPA: hypothetical protein VNE82_13075 [Candidatus Binataceae bacterium]|nr:hypothetical protein [Candidatus Binataceae bacterium]
MLHMVNRAVTYDEIAKLGPLRIHKELRAAQPDWRRLVEGLWNPSRHVKGLSLLVGLAAGEAYSVYAVCAIHALTPVTAYLAEQTPYLRAVSGKYHELFDLSGVLPVVVVSLVVFAMAWCAVRGIALALAGSEPARFAANTSAIRR